mmetsp:Transcript_102288/g.329816  ORF Transcript_102288/g.329816 Transcript_102288/m.329816 type:complete len:217 (-) Transcript_102288:13-663(-)
MVRSVERYHSEAQRVPSMEPKYAAVSGSFSLDVRCATKSLTPLRAAKLPRKKREPAVKTPANLCGARTMSGREAKDMAISKPPISSSTKKASHCCWLMEATCIAMPMLPPRLRPKLFPAFSATFERPWCARPRRPCVSSSVPPPGLPSSPLSQFRRSGSRPARPPPPLGRSIGSSGLRHLAAWSLQLPEPASSGRFAPGMAPAAAPRRRGPRGPRG